MSRYIDADAFKAIINEHCKTQSDKEQAYWFGVLIDMQPTANVAPIADTVRKMQQRLKECFDSEIEHMSIYTEGLVLFAVDQIAKEMLEVAKRREDIENSPVDCSTPSVTESQREADER